MDGLEWKILLKWMFWEYHYFWKHPYNVPPNLDSEFFEEVFTIPVGKMPWRCWNKIFLSRFTLWVELTGRGPPFMDIIVFPFLFCSFGNLNHRMLRYWLGQQETNNSKLVFLAVRPGKQMEPKNGVLVQMMFRFNWAILGSSRCCNFQALLKGNGHIYIYIYTLFPTALLKMRSFLFPFGEIWTCSLESTSLNFQGAFSSWIVLVGDFFSDNYRGIHHSPSKPKISENGFWIFFPMILSKSKNLEANSQTLVHSG